MMEAAAAWWRVGVQGGHEGHAQIPECACVRAWGWPRPPLLPARAGRGEERRGRGERGGASPWFVPAPALGVGAPLRAWQGDGAQRRPRVSAQNVAGSCDGGEEAPRYSMTRQRGRCCEKYLKSSGVAPGQLVSSSSSSS